MAVFRSLRGFRVTVSLFKLVNGLTQNLPQGLSVGGRHTTVISAPTLVSSTINAVGTQITDVFSESVTGTLGLTIACTGGAITSTYLSGTGTTTLISTLSRIAQQGQTATRGYTPGNINHAGVPLATFSGFAVTNNSTVTPPTVLGTTNIDTLGTTLTVIYSKNMGTNHTGLTLASDSGIAINLTYVSTASATQAYSTDRTILQTETLSLAYAPGDIVASDGGILASFSGQSVVNNSTQVAFPPALVPGVILAVEPFSGSSTPSYSYLFNSLGMPCIDGQEPVTIANAVDSTPWFAGIDEPPGYRQGDPTTGHGNYLAFDATIPQNFAFAGFAGSASPFGFTWAAVVAFDDPATGVFPVDSNPGLAAGIVGVAGCAMQWNNGSTNPVTTQLITDTLPHAVYCTETAGVWNVYVDGGLVYTATDFGGSVPLIANPNMGTVQGGGGAFAGKLYGDFLADSALDPTALQAMLTPYEP